MAKWASNDASQPPQKKPKFPAFRSSLPRPQNSSREPRSSRSTSSSAVVTISQSDGGRRRGTGQYRNRQAGTPQPIERDTLFDSGEPVLNSEATFDGDSTVDPRVSQPTVDRDDSVDPSEPVDVVSTSKDDLNTAGRQNGTTTPASKAKRKRNNNTAVSPFHFI